MVLETNASNSVDQLREKKATDRKPDVVGRFFFAGVGKIFDPEVENLLFRLDFGLVETFPEPVVESPCFRVSKNHYVKLEESNN